MGFRKGSFATVWEVDEVSKTITKGRVTISHKNKATNEYEQDFNAYVAFIGTAAAAKALRLKERDRIRLGDIDVTTKYDKEKKITYTSYKIFSFDSPEEIDGGQGNAEKNSSPEQQTEPAIDIDDSDLPF